MTFLAVDIPNDHFSHKNLFNSLLFKLNWHLLNAVNGTVQILMLHTSIFNAAQPAFNNTHFV